MHSTHCITWRCNRVQALAFFAALPFALAFMACAVMGLETGALVAAIVGAFVLGISVGAWVTGQYFKEGA